MLLPANHWHWAAVKAAMMQQAAIYGCQGLTLSEDEKSFYRDARPWGFIVFARNIETPDQLRALTASFRETVGYDAPVLIDQEGGRVARLKPPHWRRYPPARAYGALYERDAEAGLTAARLGSHQDGAHQHGGPRRARLAAHASQGGRDHGRGARGRGQRQPAARLRPARGGRLA